MITWERLVEARGGKHSTDPLEVALQTLEKEERGLRGCCASLRRWLRRRGVREGKEGLVAAGAAPVNKV